MRFSLNLLAENGLKARIGLEIHARILSATKIFTDSAYSVNTDRHVATNVNVSSFDLALPGSMPTLNRRCVEAAVVTGLALGCRINAISHFERKHYFYPDLPAGYQITQKERPIAVNGTLAYPRLDPSTSRLSYKSCRIRHIQLEHDSARSLQLFSNLNASLPPSATLVDLNRAGLGLMEIVTEPDFESAFDCYSFVRELAFLLRSLGTCDASGVSIGEGSFRVDVNVSVHRTTSDNQLLPGARVELKNLGNFNTLLKATEYEIKRQMSLVEKGQEIQTETRTFMQEKGETVTTRAKETQYDYRFMPEPNLLPLLVYPAESKIKLSTDGVCQNNPELIISDEYLKEIERLGDDTNNKSRFYVDLDKCRTEYSSKQLPQWRRDRLIKEYKLDQEAAFVFVSHDLDHLLVEIVRDHHVNESDIPLYVRCLRTNYLSVINQGIDLSQLSSRSRCTKIVSFIESVIKARRVSKRVESKLFVELFNPAGDLNKLAEDLIKEKGWEIVNDRELITKCVRDLIDQNPKAVGDYKTKEKRRDKLIGFFTLRVHKHFNDLADTSLVDQIVKQSLDSLLK